jgi:hypothetical protein
VRYVIYIYMSLVGKGLSYIYETEIPVALCYLCCVCVSITRLSVGSLK